MQFFYKIVKKKNLVRAECTVGKIFGKSAKKWEKVRKFAKK